MNDCLTCGGFDALHKLAARNEPARDLNCRKGLPPVFVTAPRLARLPGKTRNAIDINGLAAPESERSRDCGCLQL